MGFPGKEKLQKDTPMSAGSGWVKLVDKTPLRLRIWGYVGTTTSKKFPNNTQYRFKVQHNGGPVKSLDCNWRLMKQLQELADQLDSPFEATITQDKTIAEIERNGVKQKQLVNEYTITDVKSLEAGDVPDDANVPF